MKIVNVDLKYIFLILLISLVFSFDLFLNIGKPANGDGLIHTVVPNLFANAIIQKEFPVGWIDGFANYGLPLGTNFQQLSTYLSAIVIIISHNPVLGFNIIAFLGTFLSCLFFYFFLRIYFTPLYAFTGVFLFNFTPYRILNIYIRGALPEFFAVIFFPILLIAVHLFIVKRSITGLLLFIASFTLLSLTHPFMDITALFLIFPYILFLVVSTQRSKLKAILHYVSIFIGGMIFAILMTSYFTIPLVIEIKYFYYGQSHFHLTPNNFLGINNFFTYQYAYFRTLDILNRGFIINIGVIESFIFAFAVAYFFYRVFSKKIFQSFSFFDITVISGILLVFMMTTPSDFLYQHIALLSNIQFPWRMLSAFIFVPPIILSILLTKINERAVVIGCIIVISIFSFPQLYGKNYTNYPKSFYNFTPLNLAAVVMNTIWSGDSITYPVVKDKAAIIDGKGEILTQTITNEKRIYTITAQSQIRLVDHTFYFPGWHVYVDGIDIPIEYQDPNYRGVITYRIPSGRHIVIVAYQDTKIRLLGKMLTIMFGAGFIGLFLLRKHLQNLLIRDNE